MSMNGAKIATRRWLREDNLAYLTILFTLGMGAITAYSLSRIDSFEDNTEILTGLLLIDLVAVIVLGALLLSARFGGSGLSAASASPVTSCIGALPSSLAGLP